MKVEIGGKLLKGDVRVPASKSLSHRAIIAASLSEGRSHVGNLIFSEDILATTKGMEGLGAKIEVGEDFEIVEGTGKVKRISKELDANESGSTVRFLIPIALLDGEEVVFTGKEGLGKRPLKTYLDIFDEKGIEYTHLKEGLSLPLKVKGQLKGGEYKLPGDVSSQYITGLMYTLPLVKEDSKIVITTPLESKGYVDLTLDMLERFGIEIENKDYKEFHIKGNQKFKRSNYDVEGDFSQCAFWLVAGSLGSDIRCLNMNENSLQGDKEIIDILMDMSGDVTWDKDILISRKSDTKGRVVDLSQCPDLGPIVTVLASLSEGKTEIINAKRLRIKESDRITSMVTEMRKLGVEIEELEEGMIITGQKTLKGGVEVDSWKDHRVAMALAMAGTRCEKPIIINDAEAINKSYPHFYKEYEKVGGHIKVVD